MSSQDATDKPERLVFRSYLQMVHNAVGSEMFRNFYVHDSSGEFDAVSGGEKSCAFFVSSVLTIWGKLGAGVHGTVASTEADLQQSGWQPIPEAIMEAGDVIVWGPVTADDETNEHIGFYIGDNQAISTSYKTRTVVQHNVHFDADARPIKAIYHQAHW